MFLTPGPDLPVRSPGPDDPVVSVVLPTYRRAGLLPRAARSVLDQSFADLELIVVDDEPSAEARAAVSALGDPRVRYVAHERNQGLPAARNTGVRHSRGRLISFLDDDDEWAPGKLEAQVRVLDEGGPGVGVATCFQRFVDDDGRPLRTRAIPTDGDVLPLLLRDDTVYAQVLLVRRTLFEKVGLFVEEMPFYEDYELSLRLAAATRWVTWPEAGVVMHRSVESMSTSGLDRRIAAWHLLIERHGAAVGGRARSRWWTKVARLHADGGDPAGWRRAMVAALRADPTDRRTWARALAGSGGHARLARARGRRRARAGAAL